MRLHGLFHNFAPSTGLFRVGLVTCPRPSVVSTNRVVPEVPPNRQSVPVHACVEPGNQVCHGVNPLVERVWLQAARDRQG